jgi:hypothetical protein
MPKRKPWPYAAQRANKQAKIAAALKAIQEGWVNPDRLTEFEAMAVMRLGGVQRLREMRMCTKATGILIGPAFFYDGRRVFYRLADLKAYDRALRRAQPYRIAKPPDESE